MFFASLYTNHSTARTKLRCFWGVLSLISSAGTGFSSTSFRAQGWGCAHGNDILHFWSTRIAGVLLSGHLCHVAAATIRCTCSFERLTGGLWADVTYARKLSKWFLFPTFQILRVVPESISRARLHSSSLLWALDAANAKCLTGGLRP
jgi:hypothetical protein